MDYSEWSLSPFDSIRGSSPSSVNMVSQDNKIKYDSFLDTTVILWNLGEILTLPNYPIHVSSGKTPADVS